MDATCLTMELSPHTLSVVSSSLDGGAVAFSVS